MERGHLNRQASGVQTQRCEPVIMENRPEQRDIGKEIEAGERQRAEICVQNEKLERNKRPVHDGAAKFQCTAATQQHFVEYSLRNKTMLII